MTAVRPDVAAILPMSLYRFCGLRKTLTLKLDGMNEPIYVVPGPPYIAAQVAAGAKRGQVWTISEVLDLLLMDATRDAARQVVEAKLLFAASITGITKEDTVEHEQKGTAERTSVQGDLGGGRVPRDPRVAQPGRVGSDRSERDGHRALPVQEQLVALFGGDGDAAGLPRAR